MNASSESGLCATVMVSAEVTARFYVGGVPRPVRLDLRPEGRHNEVKSKCRKISCTQPWETSRMKTPDGLRPIRRRNRTYDPSIVRQRQTEGDTPFHGGGKTSISPEGCQLAVGR